MFDDPLKDGVSRFAGSLAERHGYELVETAVSGGHRGPLIRVLIHRPGGVGVEQCRSFSLDLETILEAEGIMTGPYTLEVSSPGMTRHLKSAADFRRSLGARVEVSFASGRAAPSIVTGAIESAGDDSVTIVDDLGARRVIPLSSIKQAKPHIDWQRLFRESKRRRGPEEVES